MAPWRSARTLATPPTRRLPPRPLTASLLSWTQSVILEEDIDEDYEPTPEEIQEYAEWLGMHSPEDDDLRWIAREALKAPLPEHWKPCKTNDGEIYYFNFASGESVWDHPCDEYYKKLYEEEKNKKARGGTQKRRDTQKKSSGIQPLSSMLPDTAGPSKVLGRLAPLGGGPMAPPHLRVQSARRA